MTDRPIVADSKNGIILIENSVCFYPEQYLLTSLQGEDSVKLLSTASECLLILIYRQGDIVPKEEFLESVWGKKGIVATEHNFYQTILTVRKAFSKLGLENVIKTRYRRGLSIEDTVSIIKSSMAVSEKCPYYELQKNDSDSFEEGTQVIAENIPNTRTKQKAWLNSGGGLLFSIIFCVMFGVITGAVIKIPSGGYFDRYYQLSYADGKCQIMAADYNNDIKKIQSFLSQKKIDCTKGQIIYYSALYPVGSHSVIKCDKNLQEGKECLTYFYLGAVQEK
ncbi:TPA: winged helix-turn-helix domain-containing protein [Citrobacter freundii]|nr:winged helix-turn-helix domain-containing protein [Citrobacter freundii]